MTSTPYIVTAYGAVGLAGAAGTSSSTAGKTGGLGHSALATNLGNGASYSDYGKAVGGAGGAGGAGFSGGAVGGAGGAGQGAGTGLSHAYVTYNAPGVDLRVRALGYGGVGGAAGQPGVSAGGIPGATAKGGTGGVGVGSSTATNYMGRAYSYSVGVGGAGGAGGAGSGGEGGSCSASLSIATGYAATARSEGYGGAGGVSQQAAGGGGAASKVSARAIATGTNPARAYAVARGGVGGASSGGVGGVGGVAYATSAAVSGNYVRAFVQQVGGAGGQGATNGGAGAASSLTNPILVYALTSGSLTQEADGGQGGLGLKAGGVGGGATSSFTLALNAAQAGPVVGRSVARGGNGGASGLAGSIGGSANAALTLSNAGGGATLQGYAQAFGGQGGHGGGNGAGGAGGAAIANDTVTGASVGYVTSLANAYGAAAGYMATTGQGGAGGAATAHAKAYAANSANASASAYGGGGASNNGAGSGGAGGGATATAYARGYSAKATAKLTGGNGGAGASGGAGAASQLVGAATGVASGGALTLTQQAVGGAGGLTTGAGAAGAGGGGVSTLSATDTSATSFSARLAATGGAGGSVGFLATGSAGSGGSAQSVLNVSSAAATIYAYAVATGGAGGSGSSPASYGVGGAASAQAIVRATRAGAVVLAKSFAGGGAGQPAGALSATTTATGTVGALTAALAAPAAPGGPLGALKLSASGVVNGVGVATVAATFGGAQAAFSQTGEALALATRGPGTTAMATILGSNAQLASAFGGAANIFVAAELGGSYAISGSGTQTATAHLDLTVAAAQLTARNPLVLGLYNGQGTNSGVSDVNLIIQANGATILSVDFNGPTAGTRAAAFFTNDAPALSLLTNLANIGSADLTATLSVTTTSRGAGFYGDLIFGEQTGTSAPTISGTVAGQATTSEARLSPFSGVTIGDPNANATETLTITVGGTGGTLAGTGLGGGAGGVYTLSGSAATVSSALEALTFTAAAGQPNTSSTSTLTLSDQSSVYGPATVDSTTTVIDSDPAVAPTISGTVAGERTTSEAQFSPFSGVTIGDPNANAIEILTITVGGSGGTLAVTAGLGGGAGGVYTLLGTAAAVTGALDALIFTATAGQPNTSSTSTFTLRDQSSAYAPATVDSTTTVVDSDPAVAPTISGTVAGQATTSEARLSPFSGVTIADPNANATETLTITVGGTGGTLAGTGLGGGAGGVYTLSGTAATVTSALDALTFTATAGQPNTSSTSTFTLSDQSSAYAPATVDSTTTVVDSDPTFAPTISGTVAGQVTTSEARLSPFSGVTIADPSANATETLTITVGGTGGTLAGTGLGGGAGGVYTLSGTAATVTSALDALTFTATAGQPNTSSTSTFTLSDQSSAYALATVDSTTTVVNGDPAVAPTISGTVAGQATTSEAWVSPFSGVTIADPNANATETLTITVGGTGGTLAGTGLGGGAGGVYTLSGSAATVSSALEALTFTAAAGQPNTSSTSTFTLSDQSSVYGPATVDSTTTVIDSDPAVAPTISGTVAGERTTSEAQFSPFSGVTIGDPNANATETLTITVGGTGGTLAGTGLGGGAGGVYTLSGTAATVTSALDALTFTATAGQPNTSSTSTFTLSDQSSAYALATVDSTTTVVDSDPAVAPTISGTLAGQATTSEARLSPFSGVTIADPNANATETLTITVGGTGGTLAGTGLGGGAGGVYTLSGTAATVTSALDALTFTATAGQPNTSSTSTFTLSDQSSAYALATVDSTTTVVDSDPAVAPTISGTLAGQATTSEARLSPFSGVTIADPNANATETLTITVGGTGGTLAGTGLGGGAGGVYTLSGTAATVTSALDALTFTATAGQPNTSSTSTFTLSDQSSAYALATVDSTTTVVDSDPATSPPSAPTITGLVGQPVNGSSAEITGSGLVGATIEIFADGAAAGAGVVGGNGLFDVVTSAALADGVHALTATQNLAGATSPASQPLAVSVLPTAPTITSLVGAPTDGQTIHVKGAAETGCTVKLFANGGSTVIGMATAAAGAFDIVTTAAFLAGSYALTAVDSDAAGLSSQASAPFTVVVTPVSTAWKGTKSADWGTAVDWTGGAVPNDTGVNVTVATTGRYTVAIASGESFTAGALTINNATAILSLAGRLTLGLGLSLQAGSLKLSGGALLAASASVASGAVVTGFGAINGPVANSGVLSAVGGALTLAGSVTGSHGVIRIANGASVELGGALSGQTIAVSPTGHSTLTLDLPTVTATVTGFALTDTLHLVGVPAVSDSYANGVLTLFGADGSIIGTDQIATNAPFFKEIFALTPDGAGGVDIGLAPDVASTLKVPATLAAQATVRAPITGVSLAYADSDKVKETFTVTLIDKRGVLSTSNSSGAIVSGQGSIDLSITGGLDQVNQDLANLFFTATAKGTDTIVVTATDNFGENATAAAISVTVAAAPASHIARFAQSMAAMGGAGAALSAPAPLAPDDGGPRLIAPGR